MIQNARRHSFNMNNKTTLFSFDLDSLDSKTSAKLVDEPVEQPKPKTNYFPSCSVCVEQIIFKTQTEFNQHHKSDCHNLNIARQASGKPSISMQEFETGNFDDESINGSDSSDEEDAPKIKNSSFYKFQIVNSKNCALIYKALFHNQDYSLERLTALKKGNATIAILALGAGHFAGAIFSTSSQKAIVSKTFHRYTTRRKQGKLITLYPGGSQSANDQKSGAAKSAGAQIRRYNEQALQQDIHDLLRKWKQMLDECDLIFYRINPSSRKIFFSTIQFLHFVMKE